jgi:hypothetical protein
VPQVDDARVHLLQEHNTFLNPLKCEDHINNILKFSCYHKESTILHYRGDLVNTVHSENHKKHIKSFCGQNIELLTVNVGGNITTSFKKTNN